MDQMESKEALVITKYIMKLLICAPVALYNTMKSQYYTSCDYMIT